MVSSKLMKEEVDRAISLYHSSNYADFIKLANSLLEKGIQSEFLYSALSNVYFIFDYHERALSLSEECNVLFPNTNHLVNQARILGHMKKYDQQALLLTNLFEATHDMAYINQLIECPFKTPCFFAHITKWFGEGYLKQESFLAVYRTFLFKHSDIFLHQGRQVLSLILQIVLDTDTVSDSVVLERLEALTPQDQLMCLYYLLLSKQCYRTEEIESERDRLTSTLDRLSSMNLHTMTMREYLKSFPHHFGYYYTYLGNDILPLSKGFSKLVYKLCPELMALSTKTFPVRESGPIRIAFLSRLLFRNHSVCRDRMGIIRYLCNDPAFEVTLISLEKDKNVLYNNIMKDTVPHRIIYITPDLEDSVDMISELNLDVLVYPELGMCTIAYLLAHTRLAPIQINTWGHSESCGIPTIDYYISSSWFETPESAKNYSETLIPMKSLSTYYYSLDVMDKSLHSVYRTYGVFQTVFKYHPDTLNVIRSILERDPGAYIVIIADHTPEMREHFEHHWGVYTHRVRILDTMNKVEYCRHLQCMDILIDTYPFGGCNTTLDAFYFNKLVMTCPSDKLNGRFSYGFYKKMGIEEPICHTLEQLVSKSIHYANNKEERKTLEDRISKSKKHLFEEFGSVLEWNTTLRALCCVPPIATTPHLVVARYKEDISFLGMYPYPSTVYNKHEGDNLLPNLGREGHTYLHHIITNYTSLDDITVFVPASCYDNPRKRTLFHYVMHNAMVTGNSTFAGTKLSHLRDDNRDFQLDRWEATEEVNRGNSKSAELEPASVRPYGSWYDAWFPCQTGSFVTFFGIMAVRKADILSRPRKWYKQLLKTLLTPNPEEGHYIERSWGVIFNSNADVIPI